MIKKTVSVIIPTFNRKDMLMDALKSIFAQTRLPDEVVVVDCGSKDGTGKAVYEYNDRIILLESKVRGASAQRNIGISHAKGNYIAFLDDDDVWHPDKLKLQMEFLEEHPEIALTSSGNIQLGSRIRIDRLNWIHNDLFMKLFMDSFIHTSTVVIMKNVLNTIGGFNENYKRAEDYDLWLRISRSFPIAYTRTPLTWIRESETCLSNDKIDLRKTAISVLKENYDPNKIPKRKFRKRISDLEIYLGRNYVKNGNKKEGKKQFVSAIKRYPFRTRPYRYLLGTLLK
jgi:glycosyltransferase involved in cell wall biosynthesis